MADPQQNYRDVLSRLETKDKEGTSAQDLYDAASFLPVTGEAIAAYELPGILSQSGEMISSDDFVEAAKGTGLATLGIASVLPGIGPVARYAKKGLEGFIPYMGPKTAVAGGPDVDPSVMKMEGDPSGVSAVPDDLNLGSGSLFSPEVKKGRKLLIVSCSADKCPDPGDMEAFDRYTGDMFKSIKKQGIPEENVDLAIMSAKYGLIRRDTKIPNYNVKMNKEIANNLLNDPTQVARIKNTIEGYDEVVVEGSNLYKGVIKEAAGDIPLTDFKIDYEKNLPKGERSNYGSGRQKQSVGKFIRSNTPQDVFHYTQADVPPTVFDVNKLSPNDPLSTLGLHVSTNPKAAMDRFAALKTSTVVNTLYRGGMPLEEALKVGAERRNQLIAGPPMQTISGNQGFDASGKLIPTATSGSTMPLKADLSKPFLNPKTNKPFTESELHSFTETPPDDFIDFVTDSTVQNSEMIRKKLAEDGFTHIPYVNDFEDVGELSMIMLIDRPKGSKAVLKGKFGKNDPRERTNPDIMKAEGGVVSMKDKAVNMNRGPRGIEPFVQYFEDGGVVQTIQDYIGSFFEEEPIVPERNVFEEQRAIAEKEKYRPIVEEGIARAIQGREMDEKLARYGQEGALSQRVAASMRKRGERPLNPFEKNLGLQDDPYAKLSVPASYQTGIEFGDMETGFDLLNQLDFNKLLLAGLRDNRTLSDFVKTPKRIDDDYYTTLPSSRAFYNPSFNYIQMSPVETRVPYNATLAHEIMHKGAELLRKTSGQDLGKLRNNVMSKGLMDKAEHRYIQSLVNKAYVDRLINNESIQSNKGLRFYKEQLKDFPNDEFYKEQVKNYEGYLKRNRNEALVDEAKRVFKLYMTDKNKEDFINRVKPILEENNILTYFLSGDYDYNETSKALETMPFETSKAIFDIANSVMGEDYITQKFAENMRKSESSRLTEGYPSYFPEQIPPGYDLYTPKAEGGVIGLKDKAVNMYRNRV